MGIVRWFQCSGFFCCCILFDVLEICSAKTPYVGKIYRGFVASQTDWIDTDGFFLVSNNSAFALGFSSILDDSLYSLVLIHRSSSRIVWVANERSLVRNSDQFVFDKIGNAQLENETGIVWSTNTKGRGAIAMELCDTGNLVVAGDNGTTIWQSFSYPTDTLLSGQKFEQGMTLRSFPYHKSLHYLEIKSGDLVLYAAYQTPLVYWSMSNDSRKIIKNGNGSIYSASLVSFSWNFYDQNQILIWQFNFSETEKGNVTWAAVLEADGSISFLNLDKGKPYVVAQQTKIPQDICSTPEPCESYKVCFSDIKCICPLALRSYTDCKPHVSSSCNSSRKSVKLLNVGHGLDYFALKFLIPNLKTNLSDCKTACLHNCSCLVLFFDESSRNCYLLTQIGSLKRASTSADFTIYMKVSNIGESKIDARDVDRRRNEIHLSVIITIVVLTVLVILVLLYVGFLVFRSSRKNMLESSSDTTSHEEENLFEGSSLPVRFSYSELRDATKDFSKKLGHGGFGSVYYGVFPEGSPVAVKRLESIGQGKKEFRAEVSIIGSLRHVHLVKLKGFCSEGNHRLLVYEFMGKGSLDRWIFRHSKEDLVLDWITRFNIALGTAKGLNYLHEECDVKIVHCDIKPENVLLDDDFTAKVSDFGLARLMTREQSLIFTAVRGTRGYLAPEWITNHSLSEKTDVYSYGMVLLEIIGGRKNYDSNENSEKAHYPMYAFKMLEAGKLKEIIDPKLIVDENEERVIKAVKVALWCIQDDMNLRPSMTKVVQMLEGLCDVPMPPRSLQISSLLHSHLSKPIGDAGTSSLLTDQHTSSYAILSDNALSGPR